MQKHWKNIIKTLPFLKSNLVILLSCSLPLFLHYLSQVPGSYYRTFVERVAWTSFLLISEFPLKWPACCCGNRDSSHFSYKFLLTWRGALSTSTALSIISLYSWSSADLLHAIQSSNMEDSAFETDFFTHQFYAIFFRLWKKQAEKKHSLWSFGCSNLSVLVSHCWLYWFRLVTNHCFQSNKCMMKLGFSPVCFPVSLFIFFALLLNV